MKTIKTLLLAVLLYLSCSPAFAQDGALAEAKGRKASEFTAKISNKIQADCSKEVYDCGLKIQELMSQKKDFTEQVNICQELGQQVGLCVEKQMTEFSDDVNKLNVHDPNFDGDFDQLVEKWDK
jgi:hypothetical protein